MLSLFFSLFLVLRISAQEFIDSNLPIVIITTDGSITIPDDPKILATMKIVWCGEGQRTSVADQNNSLYLNYNGRIGIEIRGSSSQTLPKKQYGFTTLKADNVTNNNVSLLGMPKENDWILNGLGFDPSLIRDYLCYNLSRQIGHYASRTIWCEVIINNVHNGLYILEEKIKQGQDRVDVGKIGTSDVTYPSVTGGYITKADKPENEVVAWRMSSYIGSNDLTFIHVLPKPENVTVSQNDYIKGEFLKLSNASLIQDNSLVSGIPSIIDIASFVDYMIINEYSANADAYQYSTFFHKDRNGKLRAGPLWDQNLTFGNDLFIWGFDRSKINTWQFSNGDNEGATFWRDLYKNPIFRCQMKKRWQEVISAGQPLNYQLVSAYIDSIIARIREAAAREEATWHTVGNLDLQVSKIKFFIQQRISWIDTQLGVYTCEYQETPALVITKIMYAPSGIDPEFVEIKNTGSSAIELTGVFFNNAGLEYQFPPYTSLGPGKTIVIAGDVPAFVAKYGFMPFGQFTRSLSNTGMDLVLSDGYGNIIDRVNYSSDSPWPFASGNSKYLELSDPLSENSGPQNWTASSDVLVSVESSAEVDVSVYPNPTRGTAHVISGCMIDYLSLTDVSGNVLVFKRLQNSNFDLDMSGFMPGMYYLTVGSGGRIEIRKLVRQ